MAICNHVKLLQGKILLKRRSGGIRYITMPNFVEIGPSIAEILRFFVFFQDSGRPPS